MSALFVLLVTQNSRCEFIGSDGFNYPNGPINGLSGGTNWNRSGGVSTWDGTASVTNGALITNGASLASREYGGNEFDSAFKPAGQIFFRTTMTFGNVLPDFALLSSFDLAGETISFGRHGQVWGIELPSGGSYGFAHNILPNTTTTIVGVIDYTNRLTAMFVDPDRADFYDESWGTADVRWILSPQVGTSARIGLKSDGLAGSDLKWDNLVVGSTFSDVTIPEPNETALLVAGLIVAATARRKSLQVRL